VAILKHIASKNKIYSGAEQYLCFEHDAKTGKPLLDEQGRMIPREGILKASINCEFETFAAECMEINHQFHKNRGRSDIKSHDYIISFDPKDDITAEEAMEMAKRFADRFLEGHQTIIVVHPDGHNGSGNIHAHIVANSVRKHQAVRQEWHEKACEYKQGCKHKCTNAMLRAGKQWVMDECRSRGLNQVDLFSSKVREDYWVQKRGTGKVADFVSDKEFLRSFIDMEIETVSSLDELGKKLDDIFGIEVRITNKTISFKEPNRKQAIRGKRLGDDYDKRRIEERIKEAIQRKGQHKQEMMEKYSGVITDKQQEQTKPQEQNAVSQLANAIKEMNKALGSLNDKMDATALRAENLVDSYITEDYPVAAIEAEQEAEEELRLYPRPKELSEAMKEFSASNPGMERDDFLEQFNIWYDEQWRLYEEQTVQRDIKTKSR
jgi:hypothetical protein